MRAELEDIAGTLGVDLGGGAGERLLELIRLWQSYAPAINLIGAHEPSELLAHVADGLATVACAAQAVELGPVTGWVDIGSGAGLPGLIVAAVSSCELALVEPRQRRAAFLELALAAIGREAVVSRGRINEKTWSEKAAEQLVWPMKMPAAVATARAVFDPSMWLEVGEKLVMNGGVLIAHLRPEQDDALWGEPVGRCTWGRSKIAAYRCPRSPCST